VQCIKAFFELSELSSTFVFASVYMRDGVSEEGMLSQSQMHMCEDLHNPLMWIARRRGEKCAMEITINHKTLFLSLSLRCVAQDNFLLLLVLYKQQQYMLIRQRGGGEIASYVVGKGHDMHINNAIPAM
jgi:hypothetical protein